MEDGNALAADCIVISCCCQCLILQIIVFVLLKLPYKLIRKTREFTRIKLQQRKKRGRMVINMVGKYKNEFVGIVGESLRIQSSDRVSLEAGNSSSNCKCCMKEVEKVMEELSQKGEFSFGSFWCKEEESDEIFPTGIGKHEFDDGFVRYNFKKMVGSISCS